MSSAKRQIVVLSFREEWEERCPRGCCFEGSGGSDFEMSCFETVDDAADWIVQQLSHHGGCEHRVMENWQDVVDFCDRAEADPREGVYSITVPDTGVDYDAEGWQWIEARQTRREVLEAEVKKAVSEKLDHAANDLYRQKKAKEDAAAAKAVADKTVRKALKEAQEAKRSKDKLKTCKRSGMHLLKVDDEGFCKVCGHQ
jgi:hypothetical protein